MNRYNYFMNEKEQIQAEDCIELIDILYFLQVSFGNIIKSTLACLLAGGFYFYFIPKKYEASATIEMARVAGEAVENPTILLEKMKLPPYFSTVTHQSCGLGGEAALSGKFFDKIKPSINKSAPMVSFVTQAQSTQEAKACLNAAIADVVKNQDAIAKPLIELKQRQLQKLREQFSLYEENHTTRSATKVNNNSFNLPYSILILNGIANLVNEANSNNLQLQIFTIEYQLTAQQTRPTLLVNSIFGPEAPVNKQPFLILGLCLALGVFLGLFVTGVIRIVPYIRRQILMKADKLSVKSRHCP